MRDITHTATFGPGDSLERMLEDLACPACGYRDPGRAIPSITGDRVRVFCDCCGAFSTIVLSADQAAALSPDFGDAPDIYESPAPKSVSGS